MNKREKKKNKNEIICWIFGHDVYTHPDKYGEQAWSCHNCKNLLNMPDDSLWGLNLNNEVTKFFVKVTNFKLGKKDNIEMPF